MDKLLYLNESGLTLIDVNSAMQHKLSETKFSWSDWDRIETAVGGLPSEKSVAVILDFVDDSHQMHWVAKLFPWEKQAYEKTLGRENTFRGCHVGSSKLVRALSPNR
jgi:hypothetical protein